MFNYSELRDIQKKEMESSAMVNLPEDFYPKIAEFLKKKKEDAISSQSLLAMREYENIKKIVRAIAAKREEKIVLMAVRSEGDASGLTDEEKEMFKDLSTIILKSRETVKSAWEQEKKTEPNSQRIRVLKDVERYRGLDNSVYGPFSEGEEQTLPRAEAQWLLKAGMAELIQVK